MDTHDPYFSDETPPGGYKTLDFGLHPDPNEYLEVFRAAYNYEIERIDRSFGEIIRLLLSFKSKICGLSRKDEIQRKQKTIFPGPVWRSGVARLAGFSKILQNVYFHL